MNEGFQEKLREYESDLRKRKDEAQANEPSGRFMARSFNNESQRT